MTRATDITSFSDHRQNLREHLNRIKSTGRPLFITTNGETEAVVLSAEAYDELAERAELAETLAQIKRSESDLKAGRAQEMNQAIRGIASKRSGRSKR